MKKTLALLLVFFSFVAFAQKKKFDKIYKTDNTVIEASVTKIAEKTIEFTFPNETLSNSLEVSKIDRIEFASGRKQVFEKVVEPKPTEEQKDKEGLKVLEIKANTVAVLPIPFVNSETMATSEEMAKFAQNDVYNKLIESSANILPLSVQDLRTTNSLLRKAGIDYKNVDETPVEDLQKILGVDHIVAAKVSYVITVKTDSQTFGNSEVKVKGNNVKVDDFALSSTQQDKQFDFSVYFDLYKNNSKIYSKTKKPFFNFKDSWIDSMQYLLKRSPIYTK